MTTKNKTEFKERIRTEMGQTNKDVLDKFEDKFEESKKCILAELNVLIYEASELVNNRELNDEEKNNIMRINAIFHVVKSVINS